MNRHALRVSLSRLCARGILPRICRSHYANPLAFPDLGEISSEIYKLSYVSLESALHRHGLLSQAPQVLTCVTTRLPRTALTAAFGIILYRQVKKAGFFGFTQQKGYALADPEKALADLLYLNRSAEIRSTLSELDLGAIRKRRLASYARHLGLAAAAPPVRRGRSGSRRTRQPAHPLLAHQPSGTPHPNTAHGPQLTAPSA